MIYFEEEKNHIKNALESRKFGYIPASSLSSSTEKLVTWDFINQILWGNRLLPPRIRLFKGGIEVNDYHYVKTTQDRRGEKIYRVCAPSLYNELRDGATLVINSIEEICPSLERVVEEFESSFKKSIQVNAYLSWCNTPGFKTHWDGHDVLVMQIYGKKHWYIFNERETPPIYKDYDPCEVPPQHPTWDRIIERGDILIIPRGTWHHAIALNEPSLHLTFGLSPITAMDFIAWLSKEVEKIPLFKSDIPFTDFYAVEQQYWQQIFASIRQFLDYSQVSLFKKYYERSSLNRRMKFSLPFVRNDESALIKEEDKLGIIVRFLNFTPLNGHSLTFNHQNMLYTYPVLFREIYQTIEGHRDITFAELKNIFKNEDQEEIKRNIMKAVLEGIISIKSTS